MSDYLELGSSPAFEDGVQVSSNEDYLPAMRQEVGRYIQLLESVFPAGEFDAISFGRKSFEHDLGTYYEAVVRFDGRSQRSVEQAYWVEAHVPTTWTDKEVRHMHYELA